MSCFFCKMKGEGYFMKDMKSEDIQELKEKAGKLKELMIEVGTHPVVLFRGITGLKEHLSTLPHIQMNSEEKERLMSKVNELMELMKEAGKHPAVRKLAKDEMEKSFLLKR